jgi:DNA-directed RNA polymerase specialized sigma24 family protein
MAHYVDNQQFLELLREYKKSGKANRVNYNLLGKIFLSISTNFINKVNTISYSQDRKEEMISDATYYMVKYMDRFDTTKDKPFSYFTTIARNAFLQNINEYNRLDDMFKSLDYIEDFSIESIDLDK